MLICMEIFVCKHCMVWKLCEWAVPLLTPSQSRYSLHAFFCFRVDCWPDCDMHLTIHIYTSMHTSIHRYTRRLSTLHWKWNMQVISGVYRLIGDQCYRKFVWAIDRSRYSMHLVVCSVIALVCCIYAAQCRACSIWPWFVRTIYWPSVTSCLSVLFCHTVEHSIQGSRDIS